MRWLVATPAKRSAHGSITTPGELQTDPVRASKPTGDVLLLPLLLQLLAAAACYCCLLLLAACCRCCPFIIALTLAQRELKGVAAVTGGVKLGAIGRERADVVHCTRIVAELAFRVRVDLVTVLQGSRHCWNGSRARRF